MTRRNATCVLFAAKVLPELKAMKMECPAFAIRAPGPRSLSSERQTTRAPGGGGEAG